MKYQTTNLQPIKRYPTYQFHADTAQKKLPVSQVFCICVLETLRWLRSRLQKFDSLPADICTPEPENYADFSTEQLHSFSFSMGIHVDVLYLENRGLWSFHLSEPDAAAGRTDYDTDMGIWNERLLRLPEFLHERQGWGTDGICKFCMGTDGYKEGDSGQSDKRNLGCIRIGPTASHAVQRAENYAAGKI